MIVMLLTTNTTGSEIPPYCVPDLAQTGVSITLPIMIALGALLLGAVAVLYSRGRSKSAVVSALSLFAVVALLVPTAPAIAQSQDEKPCPPGYHYDASKDTQGTTQGDAATTKPGTTPTQPGSGDPAQPGTPTTDPTLDPEEPGTALAPAGTENARLVADTNRDGVANLEDDSDVETAPATVNAGAVFMANLDDSSNRCPLKDGERALALEEMKDCFDAADEVVNGEEDVFDLAPLATSPLPEITDTTTGTIAADEVSQEKVNIFHNDAGEWKLVSADTKFTAPQLREGLQLGLEGKEVVKDASWDGSVTVDFTLTDGDKTKTTQATLFAAPLLVHNHTQTIDTFFTLTTRGGHFNGILANELKALADANGTEVKPFEPSSDPWVQDVFEPMYQSMPGVDGVRTMRVMLRSDQVRGVYEDEYAEGGIDDADKEGIYQALYGLRGPGTGVLSIGESTESYTLDSSGNIETLPPLPGYPAGRVLMGQRTEKNLPKDVDETEPFQPSQAVQDFFNAQGVQKPIRLDTSFLSVGHIDEFLTTVPADSELGWKLVVSSPKAGYELIKKLQDEGHGDKSLISEEGGSFTTIDLALEDGHAERINLNAERIIEENIDIIKAETGISDDDIVRVPMFYRAELNDDAPGGIDLNGDFYAADFIPNPINGVVMKNREFIAPKVWGPVINGTDVFEKAVTEAYAQAGITVKYANTYQVLYVHGGEVHCGTNALRDPVPYFLQ
ncbi:MAG: protein-arginine deiminase family protein [Actinomycetaceae bacterium]|nr:protein-arginine deiminase family protein [Actinomycetaceae bacterium]